MKEPKIIAIRVSHEEAKKFEKIKPGTEIEIQLITLVNGAQFEIVTKFIAIRTFTEKNEVKEDEQ